MNDPVETALRYEVRERVALLTITNPPVNALSEPVRNGLASGLRKGIADPHVEAIIISGDHGRFAAGADIREFGAPRKGVLLAEIQKIIEESPKPVVAALDGHALGGGLELALAAHFRIGTPAVKLGLPEVTLGLLPGGGGTQRLTRLAGPAAALDLILSGKHIGAQEALAQGIIDVVSEGDLLTQALAFARECARAGALPKAIERTDRLAADPSIFEQVRKANASKWMGQVAPFEIVDCIESATRLSPAQGLAFEREAFNRVHDSPQRAALIHLFLAERRAAKVDGLGADTRSRPIASIGIVGAGMMGAGIAMAAANAGVKVVLLDVRQEALDTVLNRIWGLYMRSVERGSTSRERSGAAFANIRTTLHHADLANIDLVVEAALEDMETKRRIFDELGRSVKPGAILATNTSALDIDRIAEATSRPGDVIGLHFFSPANVMKLLEIVRGRATSDETIATAIAFAKRIAKVPVLSSNAEGFIGNRILKVYGREAEFLLEEGATPAEIDTALQAFGLPMGVFLMRDMAGLDVAWRVRRNRMAAGLVNPADRYAPLADRLCELGRFGQKTGAGYYRYEDGKAVSDPEVEALLKQISQDKGFVRRSFASQEITRRVLCAMVNEAAFIVQEGVAQRASDIDVVYANGYGFPRHRGGPMFWAEQTGLAEVLGHVQAYHAQFGSLWTPAALLVERAAAGRWED